VKVEPDTKLLLLLVTVKELIAEVERYKPTIAPGPRSDRLNLPTIVLKVVVLA
jgi:hypothetical protein